MICAYASLLENPCHCVPHGNHIPAAVSGAADVFGVIVTAFIGLIAGKGGIEGDRFTRLQSHTLGSGQGRYQPVTAGHALGGIGLHHGTGIGHLHRDSPLALVRQLILLAQKGMTHRREKHTGQLELPVTRKGIVALHLHGSVQGDRLDLFGRQRTTVHLHHVGHTPSKPTHQTGVRIVRNRTQQGPYQTTVQHKSTLGINAIAQDGRYL